MGIRSRYTLLTAVAALVTPTLVHSAPTLALAGDAPSFSVKCWRMETSIANKQPIIARAATDDACPVSVSVADLTAPFAPGDDVPAIWTVTLKSAADTTNVIAMPLPPPASANDPTQPSTQIAATYVRSCASIATCDPTNTAASSSALQTSNFTAQGEPLSFSTIRGVKFASDGAFPIAAFVTVKDAVTPGVTYVFAAYSSVTIKAKTTATAPHQEGVVQCRMSRQSALNATLDAAASVSVSSNCEVRMALAPLAVVRPNGTLTVSWVATLARRADADIYLPTPLIPMAVGDNTNQTYEIVASYVKLCKYAMTTPCDEYTPVDGLQAQVSAGPASFSPSGNVTFTSPPITLATAGPHAAMLHLVVAGPSRRYDFLYDFTLLATPQEIPVQAPVKTDAKTAYCWDTLADATRTDATQASVTATASGSDCPYLSTLALPASATVSVGNRFDLNVSLSVNANYSALSSPLATQVNLSTVYDPISKSDVSLPTLYVFACSVGTACSPFSTDKTLLLKALPARNLVDGTATVTVENLSIPSEGNYTILVHSVFPNGASRIDTAVYGAVRVVKDAAATSVTVAKGKKSHTVLYVLVSVGSVVVVVLLVLAVVWLRRRRQQQRMEKMVQFGLFPATRPGTMIHHTPDSRGSLPSGESGRGSFSFLRVQASQPSPMDVDTPRDGSLSYDPYQRASFQDMSMPESNLSFAFTENERPSGLTYDDGPHKAYNV